MAVELRLGARHFCGWGALRPSALPAIAGRKPTSGDLSGCHPRMADNQPGGDGKRYALTWEIDNCRARFGASADLRPNAGQCELIVAHHMGGWANMIVHDQPSHAAAVRSCAPRWRSGGY